MRIDLYNWYIYITSQRNSLLILYRARGASTHLQKDAVINVEVSDVVWNAIYIFYDTWAQYNVYVFVFYVIK